MQKAGRQDLIRAQPGKFFRARIGRETGLLVKSFSWDGVLEIRSDAVNLRRVSSGSKFVIDTAVALLSTLPVMFMLILIARPLGNYIASVLAGLVALVVALITAGILLAVLLPTGIMGLLYFFDYLFLKVESHYSHVVAVLRLQEVHTGTFRHTLNCIVEDQPLGQGFKGKELLITVAATRRGLIAALASLPSTVSTPS